MGYTREVLCFQGVFLAKYSFYLTYVAKFRKSTMLFAGTGRVEGILLLYETGRN